MIGHNSQGGAVLIYPKLYTYELFFILCSTQETSEYLMDIVLSKNGFKSAEFKMSDLQII